MLSPPSSPPSPVPLTLTLASPFPLAVVKHYHLVPQGMGEGGHHLSGSSGMNGGGGVGVLSPSASVRASPSSAPLSSKAMLQKLPLRVSRVCACGTGVRVGKGGGFQSETVHVAVVHISAAGCGPGIASQGDLGIAPQPLAPLTHTPTNPSAPSLPSPTPFRFTAVWRRWWHGVHTWSGSTWTQE